MAFTVTIDGIDVFDLTRHEKALKDAKISDKLNDASSFSFKMPPMHEFILNGHQIQMLKSTVLVMEDDECIFAGRPSEINFAFNRDQEIYCEGQLSYFNDTLQPEKEFDTTTIKAFLQELINNHNSQVDKSRQFTLGKCTFSDDKQIYRKLAHEKTLDAIKNMLLNAEGGYIFTRYENGVNYIDYLEELTDVSNQPVEFGVNLQALTVKYNADNMYSQLLVSGTNKNSSGSSSSGGDNKTYYENNPVRNELLYQMFGPVTKTFDAGDDWGDQAGMKKKADDWLDKHKFDYLTIEATGIDLSYKNMNWDKYKMSQVVPIRSTPHDINAMYAITSMDTDLNKEQRIIKTGTETVQDLTEITKQETASASGGGGYSSSSEKKTYKRRAHMPVSLEKDKYGRYMATYDNGEQHNVSRLVSTDSSGRASIYADRSTGHVTRRKNSQTYTITSRN